MELRQLRYFEAVVRCGGFTRAADQLHIAQPAVSAQVRALEEELGTPLLVRQPRAVALTPAGERVLDRARRVLGEVSALHTDVGEAAGIRKGRLRIGVTSMLESYDVSAVVADFRHRYPGVQVQMRSALSKSLASALDRGQLDIILGPIHDPEDERFDARVLIDETAVLVTPPGHRLADGSPGDIARARDEAFVCLAGGTGLREILERTCEQAGFTPRVPVETYGPASIRGLVSAGTGVGILARTLAQLPGPPIDVHPISPDPPYPPLGYRTSVNAPPTPALTAFLASLDRLGLRA